MKPPDELTVNMVFHLFGAATPEEAEQLYAAHPELGQCGKHPDVATHAILVMRAPEAPWGAVSALPMCAACTDDILARIRETFPDEPPPDVLLRKVP